MKIFNNDRRDMEDITISHLHLHFHFPGEDGFPGSPKLFFSQKLADLGFGTGFYGRDALPSTQPTVVNISITLKALIPASGLASRAEGKLYKSGVDRTPSVGSRP